MGLSSSSRIRGTLRRSLAAGALAGALLLPAVIPSAPSSAHAGWWDDLDKGEPVKLSDLVFEPDRFKGKVVTFACIHHEPADIFSPYFTSFTPEKFFNFTCWLDGSPLWELEAFQRDDFPYLYLRRDHPQRDELFRVEPYTRIEYTGRVRDVFRQRPWIEILAFRRTPATLGKRVLDWVTAGDRYLAKEPRDLVAAESHYKLALAEISLDETYKLRIRKRLADVLRAAGKDDAARGVDGGVPILGGTPTPGVGEVPSLPGGRRPAVGTNAPPPAALTSDLPGEAYDSPSTPKPTPGGAAAAGAARSSTPAPVTVPGSGFRPAVPSPAGAPPAALTEDLPGTPSDAPRAPSPPTPPAPVRTRPPPAAPPAALPTPPPPPSPPCEPLPPPSVASPASPPAPVPPTPPVVEAPPAPPPPPPTPVPTAPPPPPSRSPRLSGVK